MPRNRHPLTIPRRTFPSLPLVNLSREDIRPRNDIPPVDDTQLYVPTCSIYPVSRRYVFVPSYTLPILRDREGVVSDLQLDIPHDQLFSVPSCSQLFPVLRFKCKCQVSCAHKRKSKSRCWDYSICRYSVDGWYSIPRGNTRFKGRILGSMVKVEVGGWVSVDS